ncbi:MAG TPA: AAA domain-containing protein [Pyrinomonadaceae bacterium]|jgi:hypothetical protein|nr:AAA domain-containing protein [Pyrinomonadaceae bacterium]
MNRRHFHSSIKELENLFEHGQYDQALLRDLEEELQHRKTDRAAKLRLRINARLLGLRTGTTPPPKQPSIDFTGIVDVSKPVMPKPSVAEREQHTSFRRDAPTSASLRVSLRNNPQPPQPSINNSAKSILSAWIALEVLSPPAFRRPEDLVSGDRSRISPLRNELPWERGERSRPNYRLYYQIVLGSIQLEPPLQMLMERYADSRIEKPSIRGKAALAVIIVDREGHLISPPSIGVSSFGWGVITALKGKLADLADWSTIESQLVARIGRQLVETEIADETGASRRPVTRMALFNAYDDLVSTLELPVDWLEPPEFIIRSYTYFKDRNPPESILLNSFFLSDIALARDLFISGKAPKNLKRYLGIEKPTQTEDLVQNSSALEQAISPALTPLARWPASHRNSLVLLQQAAVNLGFKETRDGGLLGINGPPGTGKTTLLRDFVAGVVTERALGMARFDDPETAFETTGLKLKAGSGWIHLYRLNTSLRGFEMVVASSNNKAVENVSGELPGLNAIASDASDLRYFKTLSDSLHSTDTWGMIAAVLGNMQNRSRFKQSFWWDEDKGFNAYLRAAIDSSATEDDSEQKQIVRDEQPPKSRDEALTRWRLARDRFTQAVNKSQKWQSWLSSIREDVASLHSLAKSEATAQQEYRRAANVVQELKPTKAHRTQDRESAEQQLRVHALSRPGLWARLLRTEAARKWNEFNAALIELHKTELALTAARTEHETTKRRISEAQKKHGVVLADSEFFELRHDLRHLKTPWFCREAQQARDDVFVAAMHLHRAFIDAAARPLRHNLGALMNAFTTQTLPTPEKQALLADLWASLFLVVPLVSTTFASVNRMLGKLPLESIGWLFIDEAGQAVPQAAVGALMRSKRAIIVGDPIQIEPVVVLPDSLTDAICCQFGVDSERFSGPRASVQTLADSASNYATEFETRFGSRTVGVPLLVHRRCSEPMFSISNRIAYANLMVKAKSDSSSEIRTVLGPSRWVNVQGSNEDKWCQEEGAEVLHMISALAHAGASSDLYIISPFVMVADRLRHLIRASNILAGWVEDETLWISERIGTVHTAQGREAEAVIIVLGAPDPSQTGARDWAGHRPNLLNVAVTRAKEAVYVVGNKILWRDAGVFSELEKTLK